MCIHPQQPLILTMDHETVEKKTINICLTQSFHLHFFPTIYHILLYDLECLESKTVGDSSGNLNSKRLESGVYCARAKKAATEQMADEYETRQV